MMRGAEDQDRNAVIHSFAWPSARRSHGWPKISPFSNRSEKSPKVRC